MSRTPEDIFEDLTDRGRTPFQIRAIAVALENDKLMALAVAAVEKEKSPRRKKNENK